GAGRGREGGGVDAGDGGGAVSGRAGGRRCRSRAQQQCGQQRQGGEQRGADGGGGHGSPRPPAGQLVAQLDRLVVLVRGGREDQAVLAGCAVGPGGRRGDRRVAVRRVGAPLRRVVDGAGGPGGRGRRAPGRLGWPGGSGGGGRCAA